VVTAKNTGPSGEAMIVSRRAVLPCCMASPAELRALSRRLVAHAREIRADAEDARLRGIGADRARQARQINALRVCQLSAGPA
jgi:hypothetical protein